MSGPKTPANATSIASLPRHLLGRHHPDRFDEPFTIQFFSNPGSQSDPSDFGEGKTFIGQTNVTTNANGNGSFTFVSNRAVPVSYRVTATATGAGGTSEFSRSRIVVRPI